VEKFIGQEDNRSTLLKEQREVELKLATAKKSKDDAEAKFTELKASGIGSTEVRFCTEPPLFPVYLQTGNSPQQATS